MKPYQVVVTAPALSYLRRCPRRTFDATERLFAVLERAPRQTADLEEKTDDGRILFLRFLGSCVVTYWLDDAVREIRVVRIEPLSR